MPPKTGNYVLDRLQELAPRVAVNQDISFKKYCHTAQLLLSQVEYRCMTRNFVPTPITDLSYGTGE
jgi:hypothetical protein